MPQNEKKGFWVPVDPAFGYFKVFPGPRIRYVAFAEFPRIDADMVEMKVEYA